MVNMWNDIVTNLSKFSAPTLTGTGVDGFPFSIRCAPELDHAQKRLYKEAFHALRFPGMTLRHFERNPKKIYVSICE